MSLIVISAAAIAAAAGAPAQANAVPSEGQAPAASAAAADTVTYPGEFFTQFAPSTALDMVRRVPGFSVNSGNSGRRGFAGSGGNVLIDGRRPSAKSEDIEDILTRIPANQVVRVELLRGAAGVETGGQAVLANVVRTPSAGAGRYELEAERNDDGRVAPRAEVSWNGRTGAVDYTVALNSYLEAPPLYGSRVLRDGQDRIIGFREDATPRTWRQLRGSGSLGAPLLGGRANLNASLERWEFRTTLESQGFNAQRVRTDDFSLAIKERQRAQEIGADWERGFGPWTLRILGLDTQRDYAIDEGTIDRNAARATVGAIAQRRRNESRESILRSTLERPLGETLNLTLAAEGAVNTLGTNLSLTRDSGAGPVAIRLPSANVDVREERAEASAALSWKPAPRWTIEPAIAVETSVLSVSGDSRARTELTFWKPSFQVVRQIGARDSLRVRLARQVGQLDFGDFASSSAIADDRVAAGNPNLQPDTTWALETELDKRFGESGAATLTFEYGWVQDVTDLAPIGGRFDAPGNIGDGTYWELDLTTTLPLTRIAKGLKLTLEGELADSSVRDPVTGQDRIFSEFAATEVSAELRHDIAAWKLAWGASSFKRGQVRFFRLGELETYEEGARVKLFVETTAIKRMKVSAYGVNLDNQDFVRNRRFFTPDRTGALLRSERRQRNVGPFVGVTISGAF